MLKKKKKAFWEMKNPKKKSKKMTPRQIAKAKLLAKKAGRPYPNLVDNARVTRSAQMFKVPKNRIKKFTIDLDIQVKDESLYDFKWWMNRDYRYNKEGVTKCQSLVKDQKKD